MERLTVKETAALMNVSVLTVRTGMEQGVFPIGAVVRNGKRANYVIYRNLVEKFMKGEGNGSKED